MCFHGKNILNSRAELIQEGKDVACILKGGNVVAVVGYKVGVCETHLSAEIYCANGITVSRPL